MNHPTVHNFAATRALVVLCAILIVLFWRTALKWLIMILAIAVVASLGYGALALWHGMHHLAE